MPGHARKQALQTRKRGDHRNAFETRITLERVRKRGGAGYQPAPLGKLPSGREAAGFGKEAVNTTATPFAVPPGKLPGGTGW